MNPIAYLYHDADKPENADPMIHSTLIVFASDRKPNFANETPLFTLDQASMLADSERDALAKKWIAFNGYDKFGVACWIRSN